MLRTNKRMDDGFKQAVYNHAVCVLGVPTRPTFYPAIAFLTNRVHNILLL